MSTRRKNRVSQNKHRAPIAEPLESRTLLSAGGGFAGSGILGSYYLGTNLDNNGTVQPSFTRTDDRIDFNFGTTETPGGSSSPGFNAIGATDWSARWVGQVIPKYSETYTFTTTSSAGVRLYIEAPGATSYTMIVNDWTSHSAEVDTAAYSMAAGEVYGIKLEYYQATGAGEIKLHWSGANFTDEPIEPATQIGVNGGTAVDWDPSDLFADAMKESRIDSAWQPNNGNAAVPLDSNGWPQTDCEFYVFAGLTVDTSGQYTMTFTGQATIQLDDESLSVGSPTYNAQTNTTTLVFRDTSVYPNGGNLRVTLTNTKRTSTSATNTGITNISIMRPLTPGNMTQSYPAGTLYTSAYETLVDGFTAVRFMDFLATNSAQGQAGGNATVNWSDRLLPSASSQQGIVNSAEIGYQGQGGSIEYAVELCNETGKDMWFNVPFQATDAYVTDWAEGLLYGFSASGVPYTQPTANPAYAPLNSNLKVYLEYSNEVWNSGFYQNSLSQSLAVSAVNNNTADGQIINYDGIGTGQATVLGERYWALRTVQISNDFRAVWGNAEMMYGVRPVFEFQYSDDNNTAGNALAFIADYFDNQNGSHVSTPEPVNYYLFGAGGGWYNSVDNDQTATGAVTVANNSFEVPALPAGTSEADPTGASWTFNGSAGIVSNDTSLANASTGTTISGSTTTPTSSGDSAIGVGYSFTVGSSNIYVTQLGRWIISGNTDDHTLFLCNSSGGVLAQGTIATAGQTAGQYAYVSIGTVQLLAGQTYSVISTEPSYDWQGFDAYYPASAGVTETAFSGITLKSAISVNMPQGEWQPNLWDDWATSGSAGSVAGPVDFRYYTAAGTGTVTYPPSTANGSQGAYIQGTASISQTLTLPAGVCDVTFNAAQGALSGSESVSIYIDGSLMATMTPADTYYTFYRPASGLNVSSGSHVLKLVGSGNGTAFIDFVQVETVAAIINSGDQSIASQTQTEVDWASAYGLQTTGYEGGFEVGGDLSYGSPVAQAANVDPSVVQSTVNTVDEYLSAGGFLPMVFTAVGEWWSLAMSQPYGIPNIFDQGTPKLTGYADALSTLPPVDSNALAVPGTLTPTNESLLYSNYTGSEFEDTGGDILLNTGWISWNMMMPETGSYTFTVTTSGSGSGILVVDGNTVGTISSTGTYATSVNLQAGPNTVRVESTSSATLTVGQIVVSQVGAPAAPTITSAAQNGTSATLAWQSVSGATGYIIGYGSISGQYTTFVDVGNVATATITGLSSSGVNFMVVYAYNSSDERSLPSSEVRLAPRSTDPTAFITFNDQSDGQVIQPLVEGSYDFTSNNETSGLTIEDPTSGGVAPGWPSKVLFSSYWGDDQIVTRSDGHNFDLYSLDLGDNYQALSVLLTGYEPGGGTLTTYVNFPQDNQERIVHLVLGWVDITELDVHWCDTANGLNGNRFGAITNLLLDDAPPTITTPAAASASVVTGTSTNLSVLGADQAGASALIYTWAATTLPAGASAPAFSANGTNAARNSTVYFTAAGNYVLAVTIADAYGATTTETVPVTVEQTLTGLTIKPASTTVADGSTVANSAAITDQFGNAMGTQPASFSWSMLSGGAGTVNASSGTYTAPSTGSGWATIQASGGGYTGSVSVYFTPSSSLVPNYYAGFPSSSGLSVNGSTVGSNQLLLTDLNGTGETRSAFYSTKLTDSSFVTDFVFQVTNPVLDGFTFTIQNKSATALGGSGTGLGYSGITSSVALKFDLSGTNLINSVGLFTGGTAPTTPDALLGASGLDLDYGDMFHAHVAYNGTNLTLTLTDISQANYPSVTETYAVNIPSVVGSSSAWFGFTAASGSVAQAQSILWWTYGQPIISLAPVVPNQLAGSLQSLTLNSTRPLAGLGLSNLSLSENGQSISLATAPTISSGNSGLSYTIGNLGSLTGNFGSDTFTVSAAGLNDVGGNAPVSSATTSWSSNTLTALAGQSITIAGAAGSTATVTINGGTPYTINLATLSPIYVNGSAGGDSLTLDFTNASPVPAGGITFTGGSGDSLTVIGTAGSDVASLGGSQLIFDSSTINLPGVPTLILSTGAGNDLLTQTSQPAATSVTFQASGTDQLNVSGGVYTFTVDPQTLTPNLTVSASGPAASVVFSPQATNQIHIAGLMLTGGATASVPSLGALRMATNHRVLVVGAAGSQTAPLFSIDSASLLDLQDNDLVIHGGNLATTSSLLEMAYGNGTWAGEGIGSSIAGSTPLMTLGVMQPPSSGAFDGEPVSTNDVVVKYTYYGDANLSGAVDASDYSLIDNGFLNHLTGWYNGDFNYDGVINGSDYTLIDNAYNMQAGPLSEVASAAGQISAAGSSFSSVKTQRSGANWALFAGSFGNPANPSFALEASSNTSIVSDLPTNQDIVSELQRKRGLFSSQPMQLVLDGN